MGLAGMSGLFTALTDADLKRIAVVLLLIIFNVLFAVVGAIMKGGFKAEEGGLDINKLPEFVYKQVLPYVVGLAFFEAFLHLIPPSMLVSDLFHGAGTVAANTTTVPGLPTVDPTAGWKWLDPTVLWSIYGAIVIDLAYRTFTNFAYMFGKGISLAQRAAAK